MNEQLILDAFEVKSLSELRERQRRLVSHIEYLEFQLDKTQNTLALFRKATSDCWLRENITND